MVERDNEERRPNNDAQVIWSMDNKADMLEPFGAGCWKDRNMCGKRLVGFSSPIEKLL